MPHTTLSGGIGFCLGLESWWGSGVSQPCPTVLHKAFPWYWPVHPDIYGFAFYALYALSCIVCLVFSGFQRCYFESISAHASGTALGLNPAGDPVFRNHAPPCSTALFHGTRFIQTSMALPSMPCMPCKFALYCLVWLCLLCLVCLVNLLCIALYLAVPKMLFREHLCARFWYRLGLESCWASGVSQPCPTVLHRAFPRYSGSSKHLWLCLLCLVWLVYLLCIALYLAVPKMLFRKHLCARFWHRLGLESCWGSGVS